MTVLSQGPPFYTQKAETGCPEMDIKRAPPPEGKGSVMPADRSERAAVLRVKRPLLVPALLKFKHKKYVLSRGYPHDSSSRKYRKQEAYGKFQLEFC